MADNTSSSDWGLDALWQLQEILRGSYIKASTDIIHGEVQILMHSSGENKYYELWK